MLALDVVKRPWNELDPVITYLQSYQMQLVMFPRHMTFMKHETKSWRLTCGGKVKGTPLILTGKKKTPLTLETFLRNVSFFLLNNHAFAFYY